MTGALRVLVCGSRNWGDRETIRVALGRLRYEPSVLVIHGACSRLAAGKEVSADMLADEVAREFGFMVRAVPADWGTHGRRAGPIRNAQMLDMGPHLVMAFQRAGSRGTAHTIAEAKRRSIRVEVHER